MTAASAGGDWLTADSLAPDATDPLLAPLYAAAARGRLALPVCSACEAALELEQCACDICGADVRWREVAPRGRVHAVTVVHRREPGLIVADGPYPVMDVELDSGHRLIMTTSGPGGDVPEIGQGVQIGFRKVGGVAVPAVEPHDTSGRTGEAGA